MTQRSDTRTGPGAPDHRQQGVPRPARQPASTRTRAAGQPQAAQPAGTSAMPAGSTAPADRAKAAAVESHLRQIREPLTVTATRRDRRAFELRGRPLNRDERMRWWRSPQGGVNEPSLLTIGGTDEQREAVVKAARQWQP